MNLKEMEDSIIDALTKGFLAKCEEETLCPKCGAKIPENDEWWARFIQEVGLYIYELAIRKTKGLKADDAKRKAWWASVRRIRDERVAKIMSIRLSSEPKGLYTVKPEEVCECGKFKSPDYPKCAECAEKPYEEMNKEAEQ